ncbi:hypothetical protein J2X01_003222 [Arthrobacter ginsengisoli]|uniref:DUF4192 domain-containing protein n=1 Tax=Arthrobacter ginsengisoli TaxID=1356565 RepID=A0ABU1UFF5_9MICC|nr:DUF4192 family protein [Arthrobacter ginsengisoli]MDR7083922.1 hypothetical protein [Arthrobacter ginsengisoli]
MTAPEHLRITGPEDILGFIPHSLGYWPAHSLVAMTLQGQRLGATLRVDLPGEDGSADRPASAALPNFARSVASYLESDENADGSLLALFTETDGDGAPWAELLAELENALAGAGMPVQDAWLVGADYWRNAYCFDPSCCAPPGRPVEEIRNSRLSAEMVFRGSTVGAAPGTAARTPPAGAADPAVLAAERDWALLFSACTRDRLRFGQMLDVWARILHAPAPVPKLAAELTGYLRASLCVPPWRDAVLVMAAAGPEAAERGAEDFGVFDPGAPGAGGGGSVPRSAPSSRPLAPLPPLEGFPLWNLRPGTGGRRGEGCSGGAGDGESVRPEMPGYGEVLLGLAPPLPDWTSMARLARVLEQLDAAGGEAGAAALTGQGWIEWCRGKGSFADALFSRACEERPGYRLAELLGELVRRGTLCGWAGRREAAWQRFEPDVA